jgi:hypothetical protein
MAMSSRSAKDRYRPDTTGGKHGFTPPAWRNQPNATGIDTPASVTASSGLYPTSGSRLETCPCHHGPPPAACLATASGPGTAELVVAAPKHSRATSISGVLQRLVEPGQYMGKNFAALARANGVTMSLGSTGCPYENAVAESFFAPSNESSSRPGPGAASPSCACCVQLRKGLVQHPPRGRLIVLPQPSSMGSAPPPSRHPGGIIDSTNLSVKGRPLQLTPLKVCGTGPGEPPRPGRSL